MHQKAQFHTPPFPGPFFHSFLLTMLWSPHNCNKRTSFASHHKTHWNMTMIDAHLKIGFQGLQVPWSLLYFFLSVAKVILNQFNGQSHIYFGFVGIFCSWTNSQ
jgi:hypothetical protein